MSIYFIELAGMLLGGISLVLLALLIFNPLFLMNAAARSNMVTIYKDLIYGTKNENQKPKHARHNLDLYTPKGSCESKDSCEPSDNQSKPIIVFVYGGAWDTGHKDDYKFAAMAFAKLGNITAVPNYRLYPDAKFPHFIEDVAMAIAALPAHLSALGISALDSSALDSSKPLEVILIGHSAGAHTVAMLNTQPKYLNEALEASNTQIAIKACIGMAGPYDLPLDDPLVVGKFDGIELHEVTDEHIDQGHKHNQHDANPINLATKKMAPMLLMHGRADETVGLYHLERFAKQLTTLHVPHKTIIYDKVPHKHMVAGLSVLFHSFNRVFKDIKHYLNHMD